MYPILSIYISPIKGVDFGMFAILAIFPLIFAYAGKHGKIKTNYFILALILYVFTDSILAYVLSSPVDIVTPVLRLGKFVIILSIVFLLANHCLFDYSLAKEYLKLMAVTTTAVIIIQNIVYYMSSKHVAFVVYDFIENKEYLASNVYTSMSLYRPSSLFLEPAHFSQYNVLPLCYSLFGDYQNRNSDLKLAIFITAGLFLSTSGQGILLSVLLWFIWFLNTMFKFSRAVSRGSFLLIIVVLFALCVIPYLSNLSIIEKSVYRVWDFEKGEPGPALTGRLFTYSYFKELPLLHKFIGVGFGNVPSGVYLNGISYILYTTGVIGLLIVVFVLLDAFIHTRNFQRYFSLIYFILLIGSQTFTAANIVYYLTFIYSGYQRHEKVKAI